MTPEAKVKKKVAAHLKTLVYIGGKHHDPRQLELDFGDSPALKLNDARLWASRRSLIQLERTRNRGKQK